jgi:hypothetical protein
MLPKLLTTLTLGVPGALGALRLASRVEQDAFFAAVANEIKVDKLPDDVRF